MKHEKRKKPIFRIIGIVLILLNAIGLLGDPSAITDTIAFCMQNGGGTLLISGLAGVFSLTLLGLIFIVISVIRKE